QNSANFLREINRDKVNRRSADVRTLHIREEYGLQEILPADSVQKDSTLNNRKTKDSVTKDAIVRDLFTVEFKDNWQIVFNSARYKNQKAAVPVADFVEPLLRRDLFDHYFVAYNDSVLMDEVNLSNTRIAIPNSGIEITDSTINGKITQFGYINEVEVGGKRYK